MSQAGSQAWAFYREVAQSRSVWTIRDEQGFPAPKGTDGKRAQPFWSSRARVERIIKTIPGYSEFTPHEISWADFVSRWVPGLSRDEILVGLNWTGSRALGHDLEPDQVRDAVEAIIAGGDGAA